MTSRTRPRAGRMAAFGMVIASVAVAAGAARAPAAPAAITYNTVFQDPGANPSPDLSLERHAIALIDATPAGESSTFAVRDFNRRPVAEALISAHRRGVRVDGVVDGGERAQPAVQALLTALGPDRVVICGSPTFAFNSCIANSEQPSQQHNKFLAFSRLNDGREHVVLQTSKNFLQPSQLTYYNASELFQPARLALGLETSADVTLRVAGSDGHLQTASGLKRLHVEMSGAQTGSWDFPGETDGYNVQELVVSAEGTTTITYFSEDSKGNTEPARTQEVRIDKTAPTLTGLPRGCELWPPNRRLVHVADVSAFDAESGVAQLTLSGWSNDSDDEGDIVIEGGSISLRAEHAARGRHRTYTVRATATDLAGNVASGVGTCEVPRSRGVAPHRARKRQGRPDRASR